MANEDRKGRSERSEPMEEGFAVLRADVAGIDVGSEKHWVCAPGVDGAERSEGSTKRCKNIQGNQPTTADLCHDRLEEG